MSACWARQGLANEQRATWRGRARQLDGVSPGANPFPLGMAHCRARGLGPCGSAQRFEPLLASGSNERPRYRWHPVGKVTLITYGLLGLLARVAAGGVLRMTG